MRARPLLAALVALSVVALVGASTTASAGRACATGAGGYSYAGHQSASQGHGVRATITLTRVPAVEAGHVAGWVGLGGPGQGANGGDAWIQAGIASVPGTKPFVYAEITREGRDPRLVLLEQDVAVGRSHSVAVLELAARPGWWRVWLNGRAVTKPVRIAGSSGRWAPIATAESWNAGTSACNAFGFHFERVSVAHGVGGSWRPLVSGHRFLDRANRVREVAGGRPYAFAASS